MAYKPKPKPKPTKESFTLSDCLTFIIDCQSAGVKVGRDAVKRYCNVTESTARKAVDMVKAGFGSYFHSQERRKRFKATKTEIPVNERLAQIHDADLANFAEKIKV